MAGNTQDKRVNDQKLRGLKEGETLTESLIGRGSGSILFRRQGSVTTALYRYSLVKKSKYHTIGPYRSTPSSTGLSLAEIREKARHLVELHKAHGDIKEHLAREAANEAAQTEAARIAAENDAKHSFGDLLHWYVRDMNRRGKIKAGEAARLFQRHVFEKHPSLVIKSAKDISHVDIAKILVTIRDSKPAMRGIGNTTRAPLCSMRSTTDTVHTYLSAAFSCGMSKKKYSIESNHDPIQASEFGLMHNPAAAVEPLANVYTGDTESLEQEEMAELLRYLDTLDERKRAAALSAIYLGGQRLRMLMALRWEQLDEVGMLLFDEKGNRDKAFPHFLPMTPRIREVMAPLLQVRTSPEGPFALTENLIRPDYISKLFSAAGAQLAKEGKATRFSWQNVRATCETLMAGIGISEAWRAQVLSHGRSGVQPKFYDRNAYLYEKTQTLEAWGAYLDELRSGRPRKGIKVLKLSELRSDQRH